MAPEEQIIRDMVRRQTGSETMEVSVRRHLLKFFLLTLPITSGITASLVLLVTRLGGSGSIWASFLPSYVGLLSCIGWAALVSSRVNRFCSFRVVVSSEEVRLIVIEGRNSSGKAITEEQSLSQALELWGARSVIRMVKLAIRSKQTGRALRLEQSLKADEERAREQAEEEGLKASQRRERKKADQLAQLKALAGVPEAGRRDAKDKGEKAGALSLPDGDDPAGQLSVSEES